MELFRSYKMITEPSPDHLDFDIHPWGTFKETVRNIETKFADIIHGKGCSYTIKFIGTNIIRHCSNKIPNIIL